MPASADSKSQRIGAPYGQDLRHSYLEDQYPAWVRNNRLRATDLNLLREDGSSFEYRPLVSVLLPVRNPNWQWLEHALDSVLGQAYPDWELCVCADGSTDRRARKVLSRYERVDRRIHIEYLQEGSGTHQASERAFDYSGGEYVAFLGQEDELATDALFEVVKLLQRHPEADLVYTDEDDLGEEGERRRPHFKPGWSPDLLLSYGYVGRLCVYRRHLLEEIGGLRGEYGDYEDYDTLLRFTEQTDEVHHVPKVLYHRRSPGGGMPAEKDPARAAARRALSEALGRRGIQGSVGDGLIPGSFRVEPKIKGEPRVTILIPTRDNIALLRNCVESIERLTTYRNYEILIVDNNSADPETVDYLASSPHRVVTFREAFNYSRINNFGVSQAEGEYVLFLNDDTEVISNGWLEAMLQHAQRPEIGAVGVKLLYPDGRIQHAGVIVGVGDTWAPSIATHSHQHYPSESPGYMGALMVTRNYSAVTTACAMVRKSVFEELEGFDEENLKVAFNDVDLCLRMCERGYTIVYTPYAELYHHESASRGYGKGDLGEILYMMKRWGNVLDDDRYYNPNFSKGVADFNLRADMLRPKALRGDPKTDETDIGNFDRHPREMSQEELATYMSIQRKNVRNSRRTTLIPTSKDQQPGEWPTSVAVSASREKLTRFFVVGQAKSGTSWVRSTLNSHPEIACLGEGKFFGRDFKKANRSSGGKLPSMYSLFADSEDLRVWARSVGHWATITSEPWEKNFDRHVKGLTRAAIDYFFNEARTRLGKSIVGDKTPVHAVYLNEIHEFYPDSRIIHIIRDGRDQAVSSVFHWWKESDKAEFSSLPPEVLENRDAYRKERNNFGADGRSIFEESYLRGLAKGWRETVTEAMRAGPLLFGENYFEVKYEELLEHPEVYFERMMYFLGASSEKELVRECVQMNSFEQRSKNRPRGVEDQNSFFRKGISGDWKNYFTQRDKQVFKEEAGEMLIQLGYEANLNW